jgi:hypothetical protein
MNLRILTGQLELGGAVKDRIERRVYFALSRFSDRIESVDLTLVNGDGARGGPDKRCQILVKSRGARDVVIECRGDDIRSLVDRTADRAGRAMARALHRQPGDNTVGAAAAGRRKNRDRLSWLADYVA